MHIKSFETGFAYFPDKTGSFEHYFMACSYSQYKTLTDWLIAGHCSPKMTMGQSRACRNKPKTHIINIL